MSEDSKSIPVIENERRFYPHPDRRKDCLKEHFPKEINRRNENDRRQSRGVSKSALEQVTDILRDEQRSLISFIADKENKKQQVFRFQLTAIAILATAIVTVLPLFEQFIMRQGLDGGVDEIIFDDYLKEKIFLTLIVFNVIGLIVISLVNLTSAAVIKQITSLKSNILLAVRQLNCNREAIQDAIAANLCGFYPVKNWRRTEKSKWNLADAIYIRHNKFPIDNDSLRKFYVRRHRNIIIRLICFILWPLRRYREKCVDDKCENNINIKRKGNFAKCYKIRLTKDGEFNHHVFNKYGDIEIEGNTKLPKFLPLRVLLFGYRAAYIRSPDMMSILAMIIVTTMVALLVPAGNLYIWFRINLIPSADEYTKISEIWNYIWIFSSIDLLIILMFILHFKDIINYSMAKIVNLLKPNQENVLPTPGSVKH